MDKQLIHTPVSFFFNDSEKRELKYAWTILRICLCFGALFLAAMYFAVSIIWWLATFAVCAGFGIWGCLTYDKVRVNVHNVATKRVTRYCVTRGELIPDQYKAAMESLNVLFFSFDVYVDTKEHTSFVAHVRDGGYPKNKLLFVITSTDQREAGNLTLWKITGRKAKKRDPNPVLHEILQKRVFERFLAFRTEAAAA